MLRTSHSDPYSTSRFEKLTTLDLPSPTISSVSGFTVSLCYHWLSQIQPSGSAQHAYIPSNCTCLELSQPSYCSCSPKDRVSAPSGNDSGTPTDQDIVRQDRHRSSPFGQTTLHVVPQRGRSAGRIPYCVPTVPRRSSSLPGLQKPAYPQKARNALLHKPQRRALSPLASAYQSQGKHANASLMSWIPKFRSTQKPPNL